jgi:glycosyltransferase involved in cell wall biosynthesis
LRGGAVEKVWFAMGKEFARRGHIVTHLSRRFAGLPDEEVIGGVRQVRVPGYDTPSSLLVLKFFDLLYSLRILRKLPPADILVTNTFWLPALVRTERFGKLYVHVGRYPRGQMRYYAHAARLQTLSRPIMQAIKDEAPALADRVRCIPIPVVRGERAPAVSGERRKELLFVGRVHPEKGVHLLIEAFLCISAEAREGWRLVIVGPTAASAGGGGESYEAKLRQIAQTSMDAIELMGPVFDTARLDEFYARAALFMYPSLAERGETFGVAPLEAMACGCPALVSDLACFRDFLEEDVDGFVFDHRAADPAGALAEKISALLRDPKQLAAVGARALRKAENYSVERVASRYLADFDSLLVPAAA